MSAGREYVSAFLAHYASKYYDPAKAREYYLANRELKSRQSRSDLAVKGNKDRTAERQQAWDYAKNQISESRKAELENLSLSRQQFVDEARKNAQARREEISAKLTNLLELLTAQKKDDAEQLDADEEDALALVEKRRADESRRIRQALEKKIDAIPTVPDGVRGAQRERLVAARNKKIAKLTGDAAREISAVRKQAGEDREAISNEADAVRQELATQNAEQKSGERESAKANRERVSSELKDTIERARVAFNEGKERLIADYEAVQQEEYDAIRERV